MDKTVIVNYKLVPASRFIDGDFYGKMEIEYPEGITPHEKEQIERNKKSLKESLDTLTAFSVIKAVRLELTIGDW